MIHSLLRLIGSPAALALLLAPGARASDGTVYLRNRCAGGILLRLVGGADRDHPVAETDLVPLRPIPGCFVNHIRTYRIQAPSGAATQVVHHVGWLGGLPQGRLEWQGEALLKEESPEQGCPVYGFHGLGPGRAKESAPAGYNLQAAPGSPMGLPLPSHSPGPYAPTVPADGLEGGPDGAGRALRTIGRGWMLRNPDPARRKARPFPWRRPTASRPLPRIPSRGPSWGRPGPASRRAASSPRAERRLGLGPRPLHPPGEARGPGWPCPAPRRSASAFPDPFLALASRPLRIIRDLAELTVLGSLDGVVIMAGNTLPGFDCTGKTCDRSDWRGVTCPDGVFDRANLTRADLEGFQGSGSFRGTLLHPDQAALLQAQGVALGTAWVPSGRGAFALPRPDKDLHWIRRFKEFLAYAQRSPDIRPRKGVPGEDTLYHWKHNLLKRRVLPGSWRRKVLETIPGMAEFLAEDRRPARKGAATPSRSRSGTPGKRMQERLGSPGPRGAGSGASAARFRGGLPDTRPGWLPSPLPLPALLPGLPQPLGPAAFPPGPENPGPVILLSSWMQPVLPGSRDGRARSRGSAASVLAGHARDAGDGSALAAVGGATRPASWPGITHSRLNRSPRCASLLAAAGARFRAMMVGMIRPAQPSDAEAIVAIYNPYVSGTVITFETEPVPAEVMAERIRTVLASYPWIVLEEGGVILGYAYAGRFHPRSAYQGSVETTVYVAGSAGREGLGSRLYQALLSELRSRGFHTALALIALPNPASVALHERFGFRQVGQLPEVGWKFGAWVDVGYWSLML